jgi:hypothetical protein
MAREQSPERRASARQKSVVMRERCMDTGDSLFLKVDLCRWSWRKVCAERDGEGDDHTAGIGSLPLSPRPNSGYQCRGGRDRSLRSTIKNGPATGGLPERLLLPL